MFPCFFITALSKDNSVVDYVCGVKGNIFWDIALRRYLQDWKWGELTDLLCLLCAYRVVGGGEIQICWGPSQSRKVLVKSFYRALEGSWGFSFCGKPFGRSEHF